VLLKGLGFPYAGESAIWLSDLILLPVTLVIFCAVMNLDFPGLNLVGWAAAIIPFATVLLLQVMGRLWVSIPWKMAGVATISAFVLMLFDQLRWGEKFFGLFRPLGPISYGLYLFHVPCMAFVSILYPWRNNRINCAGGLLSWLALTVLIAWICEARLQTTIKSFYKRHMAQANSGAA
jgi:peptidoglycan/LPS O-acetylase OafA/YrhL